MGVDATIATVATVVWRIAWVGKYSRRGIHFYCRRSAEESSLKFSCFSEQVTRESAKIYSQQAKGHNH